MQTEDKVKLVLTIGSAIFLAIGIYAIGESWQEKKIAQCIFTGEVQPDGKRLYKCPDGFYRLAGSKQRNARGE